MDDRRMAAHAAGRRAVEEGRATLHDLGGHMDRIGVERDLRGAWLAGVEDALDDQGFDTDPQSDGHEWERRALARAV